MKNNLKDWLVLGAIMSTASFVVACGGGKEEDDEPSAPSLSEMASAIESPTGTVDATTAADVGRAFEESGSVPTGGEREAASPIVAQEVTGVCDSGSLSVEASSNGESGAVNYNSCCIAGCCIDGSAVFAIDTSGSGAYQGCYDYDVTESCEGLTIDLDFTYCYGAMGIVYSIEVNGDTFAVSGSMSNGNGSLTVTGANGSFTCDYTNYTGTCTDSTGGTFTF